MLGRKARSGPSWCRTRAMPAASAAPRADNGRSSGAAAAAPARATPGAAGSAALTNVPLPAAPDR